ncbi:MAG TPA: hypothetical protein DCL41_06345 [Bdellovibrionales bacterium]|nr:hypothetical protein [Bdellovibrionales bacterium]
MNNLNLEYFFVSKSPRPFSINPLHSDSMSNAVVMDALVGTLVKFGNAEKFEPYLASSWEYSRDQLEWKFPIRQNLTTKNGFLINAKTYVDSIQRQARVLKSWGSLLQFDRLEGWQEFKNSETNKISGIYFTEQNEVVFKFVRKPKLFLDLLNCAYFGFYSPENYDENENWKLSQDFDFSGSHFLTKLDAKKNEISIEKREGWFSNLEETPKKITFKFVQSVNQSINSSKIQIFQTGDIDHVDNSKFSIIRAPHEFLCALVLSPKRNSGFKNLNARRAFAKKLRKNLKRLDFQSMRAEISDRFCADNKVPDDVVHKVLNSEENFEFKDAQLTLVNLASVLSVSESDQLIEKIVQTLNEMNIALKILSPAEIGEGWMEKVLSDEKFDMRLVSVLAGKEISNLNNELMFCTKMGVRFPDPNGRMCDLIREYELAERDVDENYEQAFYEILYDEACVIPILNLRTSWIYSNSISIQPSAFVPPYPRFDRLRLLRKS